MEKGLCHRGRKCWDGQDPIWEQPHLRYERSVTKIEICSILKSLSFNLFIKTEKQKQSCALDNKNIMGQVLIGSRFISVMQNLCFNSSNLCVLLVRTCNLYKEYVYDGIHTMVPHLPVTYKTSLNPILCSFFTCVVHFLAHFIIWVGSSYSYFCTNYCLYFIPEISIWVHIGEKCRKKT